MLDGVEGEPKEMTKQFKITIEFEQEAETEWEATESLRHLLRYVCSYEVVRIEAKKP